MRIGSASALAWLCQTEEYLNRRRTRKEGRHGHGCRCPFGLLQKEALPAPQRWLYREGVQIVCPDCGKCYGMHCRCADEEELLPFSALATIVNGKPMYHWTKHHSPQRCYWCNISIAQEDICCSQMRQDSGGSSLMAEKEGRLN